MHPTTEHPPADTGMAGPHPMTTPAELRERAIKLIATIDRNLPRWRSWFPSEESEVDVPRADLLALKHFAELGIAQTAEDDGVAVNEEFFRRIGWQHPNVAATKCYSAPLLRGAMLLWRVGEPHLWIAAPRAEIPILSYDDVTQRRVLDLCAALGITLTEGGEAGK